MASCYQVLVKISGDLKCLKDLKYSFMRDSLQGTAVEWKTVFYIVAGAQAFGATLYGLFGSAELQPWVTEASKLKPSQNQKWAHQLGWIWTKTVTFDVKID